MRRAGRLLSRLQASQLSVQALTRLCSVYLFLLASWTDTAHLPLLALQGVLLAVPYTLLEALIGRPLAAGLVPARWDLEAWAGRAAAATVLPVGMIAYLSAWVALPATGHLDRLPMIVPVLLQLPLEAFFWVTASTRSRRRANLIPQLVAVGTLLGGAVFSVADLRLDLAALPAQLAVLGWVLLRWVLLRRRVPGEVRPSVRQSLRIGSVYVITAAIDLSYSVALPSVAGAVAGQGAIVVLRAMDLAFGPFHVALSATTREDIVGGRKGRWLTGARVLTVVMLFAVSGVVLASRWVREVLAADLAALATAVVALYCGYKALLMLSTWLATRHMIWATPRQFLLSGVGSRVVAFGGVVVAIGWVDQVSQLFLQLLVCEALVVAWFLYRIGRTRACGIIASRGRSHALGRPEPHSGDGEDFPPYRAGRRRGGGGGRRGFRRGGSGRLGRRRCGIGHG